MASSASVAASPAWWQRASPPNRTPRFLRAATSIQTMSQIFLVLQSSTLITVMHRSRTAPTSEPGSHRYVVSTAMLLVEIIKLVVSLAIACHALAKSKSRPLSFTRPAEVAALVHQSLFSASSWMLILPAGLYALQTHLVFVAVSNMETVSFQVTYQLKILTTVLFSIVMLQRIITPRQWVALVLLTMGVAIVQVADSATTAAGPSAFPSLSADSLREWWSSQVHAENNSSSSSGGGSPVSAGTAGSNTLSRLGMNTTKGLFAAIAASLISGFTGVYFEKLIKESRVSVSLWTRNAQLSFYSLFPITILGVFWKDGATIAEYGFFVGYGPTVWATIGLQALGGILVAICITYSDNVAKNLAASFSIVVSYIVNSVLFDEPMTLNSTIGIATVLFALYLYQSRGHRPSTPLLPTDKDGGFDVRSRELREK